MASRTPPLELVVKAVDEATSPLKKIQAEIDRLKSPGKIAAATAELRGLQTGSLNFAEKFKTFQSAVGKVGSEAMALGGKLAAMGLGGAVALGALVKHSVDAGDKLSEMSKRVGLGVDAYASLSFAAAQADVDQESFNTAMDKFNKNMGEMTVGKGGAFLKFLNEISPTLAKQMKGAKSTEAGLAIMADAMAKIDNPAKRAALSAAAFGKSGLVMGTFLNQGGAAIQKQMLHYLELSGSQEKFAAGADDLDNAIRETTTAFEGLGNGIMGELFPAFKKIADSVTAFIVKHRDGLTKWANETAAAISRWVDGGGIDRLSEKFDYYTTIAGEMIDKVGGLGNVFAGLGVVMAGPLLASIASLASATWGLGSAFVGMAPAVWAALAPLTPFIAAGASLAYLGKTIYDNWGELSYIFKGWGNSLKWAVLDAWAAVRPILEKLSGVFGAGSPFGSALKLGDMGAAALTPTPGAPLGAANVATPGAAPVQSEAKVTVDFSNMPKGTRVSVEPNSSQPVNLSQGYSMVGAP
jgi:hypothetical protein